MQVMYSLIGVRPEYGQFHRASQDCEIRPDPMPAGLRQLPNARRLGANAPDLPHEPQAGVGTKAEVMCTPQENAYCVTGSSRAVMPTHQWPRLNNSPGRAAVFFFLENSGSV